MAKCAKCNKVVTKKNPGILCGRCNKWMHGECVSLSHEQLTTLHATEADWKCRACSGSSKQKRISIILPDPEEDDVTDTDSITAGASIDPNSQKMLTTVLSTIRHEIRETIQEELKRTLQFYSDKMDDFQIKIDNYEEKIKLVENQCKDLNNKYTNMKNNLESIQIKLNTLEQEKIENTLEISGIPKEEQENLTEIVKKIGSVINQDNNDIKKIYRKESKGLASRKRHASVVVLTLREGCRDRWLEAAKSCTITPRVLGRDGEGRIYLREALTPATAYLLWKTKSELKDTNLVQFVWCKRGNILIRKSENEKIHSIRSESDVEKWVTALKK